jgi:gentisate 1,2-dioxygenase
MSDDRKATLAKTNFFDEIIKLRDEQRSQRANAVQVVHRRDLPEEKNALGLMRWYMHPAIKDIMLSTLNIYEQTIAARSHSGRLQFQGGQIIFVVEGAGYTMIDGVKHVWKARDVLNLPLKKDGIIVQHFNPSEAGSARLLVVDPNLLAATTVDRGCGFEVLEEAPEARG